MDPRCEYTARLEARRAVVARYERMHIQSGNWRALIALASGIGVALAGLIVPRMHWLYEYAWFVGFAIAAMVYLALMSGPDVRAMIPPNPLLIPVDGFEAESPMA